MENQNSSESIRRPGGASGRSSPHTIDLRSKNTPVQTPPEERGIAAWLGGKTQTRQNVEESAERREPDEEKAEEFLETIRPKTPHLESLSASESVPGREDRPEKRSKESFFGALQSAGRRLRQLRPQRSAKNEKKSGRRFIFFGAGIGALLCFGVLVLVSTAFARLTVLVHPKEELIAFENISLTLDASFSDLNAEKGFIPAQAFEFARETTKEFPATGKARVEERSRGGVKIYNSFSSAPQSLVARTRFTTEKGILFRLAGGIVVPGAKIQDGKIVPQFVEAELAADAPGDQSNLSGEVRMQIPGFQGTPKYGGFYAVAPGGFQGGAVGERPIATAQDITAAQEKVSKNAYEEVRKEMAQKTPLSFVLIDALQEAEILEVKSPKVGAVGERFSAYARAHGNALMFRKDDVLGAVKRALEKDHAGLEFLSDSAEIAYLVRDVNFEKRRALVSLRGTIRSRRTFSSQELGDLLKGKKEGTVIEAMRGRDEFTKFRLAFFPPWIFHAPSDPGKIRFIAE